MLSVCLCVCMFPCVRHRTWLPTASPPTFLLAFYLPALASSPCLCPASVPLPWPLPLRLPACLCPLPQGDAVGTFYDPMIAKLVTHGPDRATALAALVEALKQTQVRGIFNMC